MGFIHPRQINPGNGDDSRHSDFPVVRQGQSFWDYIHSSFGRLDRDNSSGLSETEFYSAARAWYRANPERDIRYDHLLAYETLLNMVDDEDEVTNLDTRTMDTLMKDYENYFDLNSRPVNSTPITQTSPEAQQIARQLVDPTSLQADELQDTLARIYMDPEGRALLDAAKQRGVSYRTNPTLRPTILGRYNPENNQIEVRNPNNVSTLVHESVHGVVGNSVTATLNSKHEEAVAMMLGEEIGARVEGRPQDTTHEITALETFETYDYLPAMGPRGNQINDFLRELGIRRRSP